MFKLLILFLLALIAGSLFAALAFIARNPDRGDRAAKALTLRVSLSLALFALLMGGFYLGLLSPR